MLQLEYSRLKILQDIAKKKKIDVFLVGGFLRDFLLDRECLDFDFALERDGLKIARVFAKKIKGTFVLLDKERGCARVVKKSKGELSTFDFADYRAKTIKGDLAHRDFTINTFALDLKDLSDSVQILDILQDHKKGSVDLKAKRIKMVSTKSFKEDPLRLLRAFSLKAVLNFKIEKNTLNQIKKDRDLIKDVSSERVREELFKILASHSAAQTLKAMDRIGLLERVMPQIRVMFHVKQGTYHHLDVWPHSLETVYQLEKLLKEMKKDDDIRDYMSEEIGGGHKREDILKLAALLHDIGKPDTRKRENGRISFHAHERVGKSIVREISKLLKISTKERYILENMVLWHLRPGYLSNFKKPSDRAIFRYFRDTKDEGASILLLSLADQRATRGPATTERDQKHHEKICLSLVKQYFDKSKEEPFVRLINGDDLIKKLKLKPSPIFSKILKEVEEKQSLGKITTKKEALQLAQKVVKK